MSRPTRRRQKQGWDVAIVGLACRFPGAPDARTFWANILAGRDAVRDVPPSRWDADTFHEPGSNDSDRVSCRRGGFLDEPVAFDPARHGVMPLAVEGGEPEQFLVLDAARAALEDAGYAGGVPTTSRVEVVIGRGNYFNRGNLTRLQHGRIVAQTLGLLEALHPEWTADDLEEVRGALQASLPPFESGTIGGQVTNATAGRLADRLDLTGASYVVDAASASALVALDLGARALLDGRADVALVGGVYVAPDVDFPLVFSRLGALSKSGTARPFSRDADGLVTGEGVGVVVLKRLADAERDGDRVYAVLKGVGVASDGRGVGLTAPSAKGHARALRRAYREAGVDPATVDLVEAHGLGVPASDRAELRALRAVFPRPARGRRALGAVSSMIGHAMPAAGMAGLIKAALALHHKVLPPTLHADNPHPLLADDDSPFALNGRARPWIHGASAHPRRAGVNAFGFAGINAHAVLEEHNTSSARATPGLMTDWDTEAVLLGADDREGLATVARALRDWLDAGRNREVSLKDLAATLNCGQRGFRVRAGVVAASTTELRDRLRFLVQRLEDPACRAVRDARGVYFWDEPVGGPGRVAFLYPGEGSQYAGMLADLALHFPEVRAVLDTADRIATERNHARLPSEHLFGDATADDDGLWAIGTAVNVVLSCQWALHRLLGGLGLTPDAVAGHSSGEILALAAAGVVDADRSLETDLGELGSLFEALEARGGVPQASLWAIAAPADRVRRLLDEARLSDWSVAIDNCPHQVVVAGPPSGDAPLAATLKQGGLLGERLPFDRAYHTQAFAAALGPVRDFFHGLNFQRPAVPVYSCASAAPMPADPESVRALAVGQWVRPVRFRETVEALHADGYRVFVEVGARGNLTGYVEDALRGRPHLAVAANLPRRSGLTQLNHLVAALYAQGLPVRPEFLYARRRPQSVDLSVDLPPARPTPTLELGFPEMSLPAGLVEKLRSRHREPDTACRCATLPPERPHRNGQAHRNGDSPEHPSRLNGSWPVAVPVSPTNHRPTPPTIESPAPRPSGPGDAAILAYFETMEAFLDTQRQVMEAYTISRSNGAATVAAAPPSTHETVHRNGSTPVAVAPPPVPVVAPPEVEPAPAPADVREVLLDQVAKRTGYPREMLDLGYDMEADLGIDSIKRVEILGEIQGRGLVPEGVDLERLSRCRTLGQVLDALGSGRPASPPAQATAPDAPGRWGAEVTKFVPGRELEGRWVLDARSDPVAQHHTLGGRRLSAVEPGRLGLPVVPFTVMAEMLAQAASALQPGRTVVALRDVQANRWVAYDEDGPNELEVVATRNADDPNVVAVALFPAGTRTASRNGKVKPAFAGQVVLGDARPEPPVAAPFDLDGAGPCRFGAAELYDDQWLFHGPPLQALTRVGLASPAGIEGTLRVLPRRELLPEATWPTLHTDPIVLDAFTHLLGTWGIDKQAGPTGDVMFPLRVKEIRLHGDEPAEGTEVACLIRVRDLSRHRVRADAELVRPDGRVWVQIVGWEDWRFYWPDRYRDVFRQPDTVLLGEPLDLGDDRFVGVWLEPPADMGRPVWRDVLEWVQFEPGERRASRALGGPEVEITRRIWTTVAAKEAARRLLLNRGESPVYPGDLVIERTTGHPFLGSRIEPTRHDLPAVAWASAEGVAVAVAASDPNVRVSLAVVPVNEPGSDPAPLPAGAEGWLAGVADAATREEWAARLRGAAAVAPGLEFAGVTTETGVVRLDGSGDLVEVRTGRRGEHVWAWTTGGKGGS